MPSGPFILSLSHIYSLSILIIIPLLQFHQSLSKKSLMAASSSAKFYQSCGIHVAMILIILLLLSLPSIPVGFGFPSYKSTDESVKEKEKLVGSRPPGCVNKCMNCKPCMASLVIEPHHQWNNKRFFKTTSPGEKGDSYYLLSWKCKCGNKLFQP